MNKLSKPFQILLHSIWFLLFVLAIVMYKERTFMDASYYFFNAINSGGFHVEHGRIVLALSQVVPLIGYYLFMPLQVLLVLGSVGHEIFYYSVFLLVFYKLKDQAGGVAVLLIHLIGQLWLYYSPMLEICYGAALSVLFYSILKSGKYKDDKWLLFLIIVQWFALTSHPENFILLGTAIALDFINRGFQKKIHLVSGVVLIVGFLMEILTFSEYEKGHTNIINEASPAGISNLFDSAYAGRVLQIFTGHYPDLLLLFCLAIMLLLVGLKWKRLILLIASVCALILLVNQAAVADTYTRYYESMYNPLVFLVVIFVVYEIFEIKRKSLFVGLTIGLLIISVVRINWIWEFGSNIRKRSAQLERVVDYAQMLGNSKYLIHTKNIHSYYTIITWANPIESLLYSAIDGKDKSVTIAENNEYYYNKNFKQLNDSNYMFRRFEVENYDFLNPRLFQLKTEPYHYLNNGGFDVSPDVLKQKVKISIENPPEYLLKDDTTFIFIKIENGNREKIPSALIEEINLSYHWYTESELYDWDGLRTELEVDIYGTYSQHLEVATPKTPGIYYLIPDIVIEEKMWFDLRDKVKIEIR